MRCPDCNKFVSYSDPECEVLSLDLSGDTVSANVTIRLNCQDCNTTLKDVDIDAVAAFRHACKPESERGKDWKPDPHLKESDEQFEVESEGDAEGQSRTEDKDRHGKQIKSSRYMKTFYGFTLEPQIRCLRCGEVFSVSLDGEEQASAFNEYC